MDRLQLLLCKLAEEASEVAKIALKTQQFGLYEKRPGQPYSNLERTHQEINELFAIIEMLNDEFEFGFRRDADLIHIKKARVNEYAQYSINLGQTEEEKD